MLAFLKGASYIHRVAILQNTILRKGNEWNKSATYNLSKTRRNENKYVVNMCPDALEIFKLQCAFLLMLRHALQIVCNDEDLARFLPQTDIYMGLCNVIVAWNVPLWPIDFCC